MSRITSYTSLNKRRFLMKTFVESQFNYCPLIWMFHSRHLNNKINNVHEKALRIVYSDDKSTFQELLDNPHMHKMCPRRPKHHIFDKQFYSKNARRLRFHVFLHFKARKLMISSFYLKWTDS